VSMRPAFPTGPFKRDLKRLESRGWNIEKLRVMISLLQSGVQLPVKAYPHKLSGEYEGFWECHIESNWLLIYRFTGQQVILARTGTHGDLFE